MTLPHRIAAGGIILRDDSILLVRYRNADESTYLVGPGGALESQEHVFQAIARETLEETGVVVRPHKLIAVEDLICSRYKMVKIWALCEFISGGIQKTQGAEDEGIIDAGWFTKANLADEVVFPTILMQHDWKSFSSRQWQAQCLPTQRANF